MAQIFVSGVAHFFVVVGGSKIHERMAHFFIDVYTMKYTLCFWQTNELTLPMSARCIAIRHTILWTMTMALKMP